MPVLARGALVVLCLLLAACDSGEPEAPPVEISGIIGTWQPQSMQRHTYATLTQTQRALDFFSPAEGSLTVSGALSASLRYLDARYSDASNPVAGYSFADHAISTGQTPTVELGVTTSGGAVVSEIDATGQSRRQFYIDPPWTPSRFTLGADTVRAVRTRYIDISGTGSAVFVEGALVVPFRTVRGGVETVLSTRALGAGNSYFDPNRQMTLAFKADGRLTSTEGPYSRTGTWTRTEDGAIDVFYEDLPATLYHRYRVRDGALVETTPYTENGLCGTQCRVGVQIVYGLLPGTVQDARIETEITFSRVQP